MRWIPFATLISARVFRRERGKFGQTRQDARTQFRRIDSALPVSGLGRAARTAARPRSGDADRLAAAGRISQGRWRRDEFRGGRCADGRQDPARRYSSSQFRRRSSRPGQCNARVCRSDPSQGRAAGIRKRFENAKRCDCALRRSGEGRSDGRGEWRWRHQCRDWGAGLRRFAGASALHLGFDSGKDGRKLSVPRRALSVSSSPEICC